MCSRTGSKVGWWQEVWHMWIYYKIIICFPVYALYIKRLPAGHCSTSHSALIHPSPLLLFFSAFTTTSTKQAHQWLIAPLTPSISHVVTKSLVFRSVILPVLKSQHEPLILAHAACQFQRFMLCLALSLSNVN